MVVMISSRCWMDVNQKYLCVMKFKILEFKIWLSCSLLFILWVFICTNSIFLPKKKLGIFFSLIVQKKKIDYMCTLAISV